MRIVLDACRMEERNEAQTYLQEMLDLPEHYGKNLDALYDCLTELTDVEVAFENQDQAGDYFKKVYRVFRGAAKENPELKII